MLDDAEIRRLALGCFLPGFVGPVPPSWLLDGLAAGLAGVVLFGSNLGDGSGAAELTGRLRAAAGRPLVFGLDEEGGDVTRLDTVRGSAAPGAAALGWLDDELVTEQVYAGIGRRLADAGITVNLAPVADVNSDPANPVIGVRSFSDSPEVAARHVAAAVRGIQRAGVVACAKHFPGHGATVADSHHQVAVVDRSVAELQAVELVPFRAAIAAGTGAVMTGHLRVAALDTELATVSRPITTGLLRNSLGFTGTIVTDALEMKAISGTLGMVEGFVRALLAGADAVETGALDYPELMVEIPDAVLAAVRSGRLPVQRLRDAARRTAALAGSPSVGRSGSSGPGRAEPVARRDSSAAGAGVGGWPVVPDAEVAARCVEVTGPLPRLDRPLVVECRTDSSMASGALPWSVADRVLAQIPAAEALVVTGEIDPDTVRAAAAERGLVCVIRDPKRHRWQLPVLAAAAQHAAAGSPVVLVDVGWPAELPEPAAGLPIIRTRGIAPGLLDAATDLLAPQPRFA
jgi:beta-N-acetylhexosaminidase